MVFSGQTVFVGNCPGATKAELEEEFKRFGNVEQISLTKTFAFIEFDSKEAADEAVRDMHLKTFKGKPLSVEHAKQKEPPAPRSRDDSRRSRSPDRSARRSNRDSDRHYRDISPVRPGRDSSAYGSLRASRDDPYSSRDYQSSRDRDDYWRSSRDTDAVAGLSAAEQARLRDQAEQERILKLQQTLLLKQREREAQQQQSMMIGADYGGTMDYGLVAAAAPETYTHPHYGGPLPQRTLSSVEDGQSVAKRARPDVALEPKGVRVFANMTDCCIVFVDLKLRGYAEHVQSIVRAAGLVAEAQYISRDESLPGTLDALTQRGVMTAAIIDERSEASKSCNLHMLHGTPRGEVQTGVAELPHWLRMHEEYNKSLIAATRRTQSLRDLLIQLCGGVDPTAAPSPVHTSNGGGGAGLGSVHSRVQLNTDSLAIYNSR